MDEKKILVVDDDRFFREILKDILKNRYQLWEAGTGEEALRLVNQVHPDLIILDIEMPGRGGIDTCRELKEREATRRIPVILVSSRAKKNEIVLGFQAGADDYLTKPIYPPEVQARIDAHLRSKGYYAELEHRDLLMLLELSDAISAMRNPMNILRMIVEKMAEVIDVDRCSIVSLGGSGDLVVKASSDFEQEHEIRLDLNRYPEIRKALETRRAVVIHDIRTDLLLEPVRQHLSRLYFNSIIVVPIIKKESVIGTFFLRTAANLKEGVSDRIYKLCHLVANISANALENAALFESMRTAQECLEEMAIRDGLTRLFSHRHFYDRLDQEFSRALRYQEPLSLIFFDIDNFKRINDSYGHTWGDEVLRRIGRVAREVVRESDIPARYGGEEFVILLPNTEAEGALGLAQRLVALIRELRFEGMNGERVTISTGVATFPGAGVQSHDELVKMADLAMYRAKTGGKDRIVLAADLPPD